jgi:putative membrane protein
MQVQLSRYAGTSILLAACVALGACKGKENNASADSAGGAMSAAGDTARGGTAASDTGMGADTTKGGAITGAAVGNLSDANIVALLDEANMADSAAGAFAVTKATSSAVKGYARMMMGEHHALRAQGQQLAKKLNITPQPPSSDPLKAMAQQEMSALQSAPKGPQFDDTYITNEINVHKAVIDLANHAYDQAQNPQLKALIKKASPVIQKHLNRAEAIAKSLPNTHKTA